MTDQEALNMVQAVKKNQFLHYRNALHNYYQHNVKKARVIIAQFISNNKNDINIDELLDLLGDNFETAFPTKIIAGIHIPRTYEEAINNPKHSKMWRATIIKELLSFYSNETFRNIVPPKGSNLVSCK